MLGPGPEKQDDAATLNEAPQESLRETRRVLQERGSGTSNGSAMLWTSEEEDWERVHQAELAEEANQDKIAQESLFQMFYPWLKKSIRENPKLAVIMGLNVGGTFPSYFSPAQVMAMITNSKALKEFAGSSGWGGNSVLRDMSLFLVMCAYEKGLLAVDFVILYLSGFTATSDDINSTLMSSDIYNVCPAWLVKVFFGWGLTANYPVNIRALTLVTAHLSRKQETCDNYERLMAMGNHLLGRTVNEELLILEEIIQYIERDLLETNANKRRLQTMPRDIDALIQDASSKKKHNTTDIDKVSAVDRSSAVPFPENDRELQSAFSEVENSATDVETDAEPDTDGLSVTVRISDVGRDYGSMGVHSLGAQINPNEITLLYEPEALRDEILDVIRELSSSIDSELEVTKALKEYCAHHNLSDGSSETYRRIYYAGVGLCILAAITLFAGNFSLYHRTFDVFLALSIIISCIPLIVKAALYGVSLQSFLRSFRYLPDTIRNTIYMINQDIRYLAWVGLSGAFLIFIAPSGIGFYLTPKSFLELIQCVMTSTCQQLEPIGNSTDLFSTGEGIFFDGIEEGLFFQRGSLENFTSDDMGSIHHNNTDISPAIVLTLFDILCTAMIYFFTVLLWTFKIGVTSIGVMTNLNATMLMTSLFAGKVQNALSPSSNKAATLFFDIANKLLEETMPKQTILKRWMPSFIYDPIEGARQRVTDTIFSYFSCQSQPQDGSDQTLLPQQQPR